MKVDRTNNDLLFETQYTSVVLATNPSKIKLVRWFRKNKEYKMLQEIFVCTFISLVEPFL